MITVFRKENSFLSNMYTCRIEYEGIIYPSVENAYQAAKTLIQSDKVKIANMTPSEAKKYGRHVVLREDWDSVKDEVMTALLDEKFKDKQLLSMLLSTDPELLIEGNWWHDNYWGVCQCSKCKDKIHNNRLGELLQRKRNLSQYISNTFTMYFGSIYNRGNQAIIENPAILYDRETYTMIKVGNYDMCMQYFTTVAAKSAEFASAWTVLQFNRDTYMDRALACEKMNKAMMYTGALKKILELE